MINKDKKIDKLFLISVALLTFFGFFIFSSASLGLLARDEAVFQSIALKQLINLILGISVFTAVSKIDYKIFRKYSFWIFLGAIFLNLLIYVPGLTMDHGGAARWIDLRFITIQPSEFLKIAFIIYFAAWLARVKENVADFKYGPLAYMSFMLPVGLLLVMQRDTDTFAVIAFTGLTMLFISGVNMKHLLAIFMVIVLSVGIYVSRNDYAMRRINTYFDRGTDTQGAGYQIQQSLVAIGSGQLIGRGFGQSIQKFSYLPEPIGDSIFAVFAEEFGMIGCIILIGLFIFFFIRSSKIAFKSPDLFSGLTVLGIAILIMVESFMNISSMLGIIPLTGQPLLFVSHGGTALIIILGASGIIANISK